MEADRAAAELYALDPNEFTVRREELSKQARGEGRSEDAKAIAGLKRPTVGAWLVNQLSRAHPEEIATLTDIGDRMRAAQKSRSGGQLRELSAERHKLVQALLRTAGTIAAQSDRKVSEQARREVEATLEAATTSETAAEEVRAGRLTAPLSHVGFGMVPESAAEGRPGSSPARRPARREAEQALDRAERALAKEERRQQQIARRLTGLRNQLEELRAEEGEVERRVLSARRERDRAARELEQAAARGGRVRRRQESAVERRRT